MRASLHVLVAGSCLLSTACARTPDVTVGYYLPKSSVAVRALRTVGCDSANNIYSATAVTAATSFSRDEQAGVQNLSFRALDSNFANSDLALTFYDDGRLKGVNATTTGKGEEIVKSAIQLVTTLGGIGVLGVVPTPEQAACDKVRTFGKDNMLTFTYVGGESFVTPTGRAAVLNPEQGSPDYVLQIDQLLKRLCFVIGPETKFDPAARMGEGEAARAAIELKLRQPARVPLSVLEAASCVYPPAAGGKVVWSGSALVPQLGTPYALPIPRAALFGKQSFAVALAESGTITSLQYGKETGATGMLGASNAILNEFKPDSAAAKAAELKAEADLIAQQQRLIRCKLDPTKCT